ncbi:MAG: glutathione S-transferase N-terminal domain-containing protein [Pseudomonadales bacterium]|jgi:GST-like protein|nr:glutathione S-transferase N-terminal domain-containing protein [Pseudomonadales bacterium]MDA0761128.1 glutathione S-transferase N-terminal domain-containing protein [Pseudomonadota bacterium]MDA0956358.1 glutathione S-transferase N-terminal domain-containing protein [Pseudomonadota bacterium]MDA1207046.1 glutathione S-transferase N-terminal domain-containing protein [Pseudomonadota bacterium]
MIELYTAPTPNGHKASVTLEELDLEYRVHSINLSEQDQRRPDFLAMNPNGRIPVIKDTRNQQVVFESGAIMIYLAEMTGRLLPSDGPNRYAVLQWLMFQMSGIGPMMGQANVFYRYFPEKIQPAIDRYQNETRRLFEVLDTALADSEWLAGEFSIADIANWCWVRTYRWSGVSREGLPHLDRWLDQMKSRPACQQGIQVPVPAPKKILEGEAEQKFAQNAQSILQT